MIHKYLNYSVFLVRNPRVEVTSNKVDNRRKILNCIDVKQRLVIDGFGEQEFARNSHGWIMNDLALLMEASTQQELDYALSKLREVGIVNSFNDGKSVREVLDSVVPRYIQTPAELSAYAEYYSSLHVPADVKEEVDNDISKSVDDDKGEKP